MGVVGLKFVRKNATDRDGLESVFVYIGKWNGSRQSPVVASIDDHNSCTPLTLISFIHSNHSHSFIRFIVFIGFLPLDRRQNFKLKLFFSLKIYSNLSPFIDLLSPLKDRLISSPIS